MKQAERLHAALRTADPARSLRAAVQALAADGCPAPEIQILLEKLLVHVRADSKRHEGDEDAVLDVLDGLAGWCHADSRM